VDPTALRAQLERMQTQPPEMQELAPGPAKQPVFVKKAVQGATNGTTWTSGHRRGRRSRA